MGRAGIDSGCDREPDRSRRSEVTSIACIGQGFIGGSLTQVLSERGITVYPYDKAGKHVPGASSCVPQTQAEAEVQFPCIVSSAKIVPGLRFPSSVRELVINAEQQSDFSKIFVVCVPTPMDIDTGKCDTSIVEGVLEELASVPCERIAVVKSTVPPGSTERWNERFNDRGLVCVFVPEFLVERTALEDMRNQDRIIIGGPKKAAKKVQQLFKTAFPTVPIVRTSSTNAEMVKYVANCFLATKVSFANEMYQIVEALAKKGLDVDYDRIIECATLDKRLGTSHWKVPSLEVDEITGEALRCWGGSCFPKDINALIVLAKSLEIDPKVMQAAWFKCLELRPGRDWEKLYGRAVSKK